MADKHVYEAFAGIAARLDRIEALLRTIAGGMTPEEQAAVAQRLRGVAGKLSTANSQTADAVDALNKLG